MTRPKAPILVVEDNADTRYILGRILGIKGYATVTVDDVAAALRYLQDGKPVCLIILDLHLPERDGRHLLRELKADPALAAIPVVVFSGDAGEMPDSAAAFVRKGDDPDVLLAVVEKHCRKD